jgi:hypothetical protein|uniref:Uncharacterized protein n=1 Tax=viral metagenome TaxID=1070528 RepID=A0A6C0DX60_9ZZZZ
MYNNISDLYKNLTDLDKSNGLLKNYFMLPGFNITENTNSNSTKNNSTNLEKDNEVINDSLFMKLLGFFDNTKNNQTQGLKRKPAKKQEKTFTRKQKSKPKQK